ncbi:MAG: prephenate dehydratase [Burkholderiales bacterium]
MPSRRKGPTGGTPPGAGRRAKPAAPAVVPEPDDGLKRHRDAIDALDREILARLSERARHAQAIGRLKDGSGAPAYRPEREAQVLARLAEANPGPLPDESVAGIFRQIMSACLALERRLAIAYLGPPGTFSHAAVARHFGAFVEAVPEGTIDEAFRAAESGRCDYAVVPVENSTEGAVGRTLDLMCTTDLSVVGEVKLRVRQNLVTHARDLASVTRIYSHAQSFAQCVQWLARNLPAVPRIVVASNAEAARLAAAEPGTAAIAGEIAAATYGVPVLAAHVEDDPSNRTRFWVLGRQQVGPSGNDETSLVMSAPNRPGAVHALLGPLAKHGVSMTRIESRPARTGRWEYLFFIDLTGHRDDPPVAAALAELAERAPYLKLLGSYPAAREP